MGFQKDDKEKEFVCRECSKFLDWDELHNGNCPECESDENLFNNDLLEE